MSLEIEANVKQQVREFYNSIGWQQIGEGIYQNARYADLRPVVNEYAHRCHLRVGRHIHPEGKYFLDAGSGPIQYPEILDYSRGYHRRVCLDISTRALVEARDRIGSHGLFVVGDIVNLPFKAGVFDSIVSLHTIHHLPPEDHETAFYELFRVMRTGGKAVVVHSWKTHSLIRRLTDFPVGVAFALIRFYRRMRGLGEARGQIPGVDNSAKTQELLQASGSYTFSHSYRWMRERLAALPGFEIRVWRSMSTNFMRAFIHRRFFGKFLLRVLFALEERAPHFFGRFGQYPMIMFQGPSERSN